MAYIFATISLTKLPNIFVIKPNLSLAILLFGCSIWNTLALLSLDSSVMFCSIWNTHVPIYRSDTHSQRCCDLALRHALLMRFAQSKKARECKARIGPLSGMVFQLRESKLRVRVRPISDYSTNGAACGSIKRGDTVQHPIHGIGKIVSAWGLFQDTDPTDGKCLTVNANGIYEVKFEDGQTRSVNQSNLALVSGCDFQPHPFAAKFPKLSYSDFESLKQNIPCPTIAFGGPTLALRRLFRCLYILARRSRQFWGAR